MGSWSWGMELECYGRAGAQRPVARLTPTPCACGPRFEYEWDAALTEWYMNSQQGLEHGYFVYTRPCGSAAFLQLTLWIRGELQPRVNRDGRGVSFVDHSGTAVVSYNKLQVLDADGISLPAWFEVAAGRLRITVDDNGANYPLTIDPIAQQAYLKASNTGEFDVFGNAVAISGDTLVVGAYQEDSNATGVNGNQADNSLSGSGAAYVFVRNGGVWSQQAYLKASNPDVSDNFGWSVAVSGDTVVVGALREASNATGVNGDQFDNSASSAGAVYVFVRNGTTWSQQAYLKASNTGANDAFGRSVAISGDTVAVGAANEDSGAMGINGNQSDNSASDSGAAYIFVRNGTAWTQQAYVKASNTDSFDWFGYSVALDGDTLVLGAPQEASISVGVNGNQTNNNLFGAGAAYVLVRSGTTWSHHSYLKASNPGPNDYFGFAVALSADTIVVGANQEDSSATGVNGNQADNSGIDSGAAYVFFRNGAAWSQQAYLKASNTGSFDEFGRVVGVSGDTIVIGAYAEDSNSTGIDGNQADNSLFNSGAAYAFLRNGGLWSQQAYLKASNTGTSDSFGVSVAVSGDTVLIGAHGESSNATGVNGDQGNNNASTSGAAYVFTGAGCPILGNMNCDCAVDLLDVDPFILALLDPASYSTMYLGCSILRGDVVVDGNVDGADVPGFIRLLVP
ncbi:MAG: FG-GAP repeat protein [Planctomycetes bacterium]|nr:FG-GAP repeat protein [Planctomycetota bacterium]